MKKLYKKYEEIINYLVFGVLATIVSIGSYLIFANTIFKAKTDLDIQLANILSWICAVIFAYFTNRKYVFKSESNGKEKAKEIINFLLARLFTLVLENLTIYLFFSILHINDAIAKLIGQVVTVITNYVLSKFIIFKKSQEQKS